MPLRMIYQSDAEDDLDAIFSYILSQGGSAETAYRYTERIRAYCNSFVTFPHRGTKRDDLYPGIRLIGFERRVTIAFTVTDDTVLIARVLYGGRDVDELSTPMDI
jgi:toxin ParE1/3/4